MSLANIIYQAEAQKYESLARGISTAAGAISGAMIEAPMRKKKETLMDLQIDDLKRNKQRQADIDSVMKDESIPQPLDKVKRLREKGYHEEAQKFHSNELMLRKQKTELEIQGINMAASKTAFLGKHANAILSMPKENREAGLTMMAQEFTNVMTSDPNTPVQLSDAIPKGMKDPTEIANYFLRMSQDVNGFISAKTDKVIKYSEDAVVQLHHELNNARESGDTQMADVIRERITALNADRKMALGSKEMARMKAGIDMDAKLIDQGIIALADEFDFDPNSPPVGTFDVISDMREMLKTMPLPQAVQRVKTKYEVGDEEPKEIGFMGSTWNALVPKGMEISTPTFKLRTGGDQSTMGLTSAEDELKMLQELANKLQ